MSDPTPPLSERDRRTLELAKAAMLEAARFIVSDEPEDEWLKLAKAKGSYQDLIAHLAAPQSPSSPATEQREGKSDQVRAAAQALIDDWKNYDGEDAASHVAALERALAAPSPAVDAGVERVIQWVRDNYQDCNIADLCDGIRAALAAMKETR